MKLNYKLCLKNSMKVPFYCSDYLHDFIIGEKKSIDAERMNFFQNNVMELSKFYYDGRIFNFGNYGFLDGHKLQELQLINITNFSPKNTSYKINLKNFHIQNVTFKDFSLKDFVNFFKNSIFVENSIFIEQISTKEFFETLPFLLEKSTTLRSFSCKNCNTRRNFGDFLGPYIAKLTNLESFVVWNHNETEGDVLFNSLRSSAKNLRVLKICKVIFHSFSLARLFAELKSLEELCLEDDFCVNENVKSITFKTLTKHQSLNLRKLKLASCDLSFSNFQELCNLIQECKYLKKLYVNFENINNMDLEKLIHCCLPFASHLQKFNIEWNDSWFHFLPKPILIGSTAVIESWRNLYEQCTCLRELSLKDGRNVSEVLPSIIECIENSRETIRKVKFDGLLEEELFVLLPELLQIRKITLLSIKNCGISSRTIRLLEFVIDQNRDTLTSLTISSTLTRECYHFGFGNCISICSKLKYIDLSDNFLFDVVRHMINPRCLCLNSLETLNLHFCFLGIEDFRVLGDALCLCKNLKQIDIGKIVAEDDTSRLDLQRRLTEVNQILQFFI